MNFKIDGIFQNSKWLHLIASKWTEINNFEGVNIEIDL